MIVTIKASFARNTGKIRDKKLLIDLNACIEQTEKAASIKEMPALKKLKGYQNTYRIKINDYRAGIIIQRKGSDVCPLSPSKRDIQIFSIKKIIFTA